MAKKHGKTTVVTLNAVNLSAHTNNTEFAHTGDSHDITTYKANDTDTAHEYSGGLTDGTVTISGVYDTVATGPKTVIDPLIGTVVTFIYQIEGLGTGKPTQTMQVLVTSYSETSPVADMITWSADLQISGMITKTTQV